MTFLIRSAAALAALTTSISYAQVVRPPIQVVQYPSVKVLRMQDSRFGGVVKVGPAFIGNVFELEIEIEDPVADRVRIEVDTRAYQGLDALEIGLASQSGFSSLTKQFVGGKAKFVTGARIKPSAGLFTGTLPILLKVTTIKAQAERSFSRNLGDLPIVAMKTFVINDTFELAQKMDYQLYKTPTGPVPFVCEGISTGPSGSFSVGATDQRGDYAVNVRSGPAGTQCTWEPGKELKADYPWRITAMTFVTAETSKCEALGSDDDKERPAPGAGTLRHNVIHVGKFARIEMDKLHQPGDRFPSMRFALSCKNTLSNDHHVSVRWNKVELIGPDDETVDQAFNGLIRH